MDEMKVCPRCAEEVKAAAQVCRYCGHEFEAGPPLAPPVAPPPPPPVAAVPPTPPAVVYAPPPPLPVGAPVAATETFHLRARSRTKAHYRDITLTVDPQNVTFTSTKTDEGVVKLYYSLLLGTVGFVLLALLVLALASSQFQGSDTDAIFGMIAVGLLAIGVVVPIAVAIWFSAARSRRAAPYSVTVPRSAVTGVRRAYDWDLGCGLMVLLALIPGLVIMLVLGQRVVQFKAPLDRSVMPKDIWVLTSDSASAQRLVSLFGGA